MKIAHPLLALALCTMTNSLSADEMKPGLWEINSSIKMQGMDMPGMKINHCYSAKDLADKKHYKMEDKDTKCSLSNLKESGGNYSYDFACNSKQGKTTGSAKGTSSANAYSAEMTIRMTPPPQPGMGEMKQITKAKRIGDCK